MAEDLIRLAFKAGAWEFFKALDTVLKEMAHERKDPKYRELAAELWRVWLTFFEKM
jgi:hypothetical protein